MGDDNGTTDNGGTTAEPAAKGFGSAGGTSDLSLGSSDGGTATLTSFDPGAFVQTGEATDSSTQNPIGAAEEGAPPPPPPDDGGTTAPPPDDGGTTAPPPDDGTTAPPPDDGTALPPPDDGTEPPPPDDFGGEEGFFIPPEDFDGEGTLTIEPPPGGFEGDGGFFAPPEGFDEDGIFFIPPEGFEGDAIFLPPPPEDFDGDGFFFPASEGGEGFEAPRDFFEVYSDFPPPPEGFEGEWQPPPPSEWDGSSDWTPPPADDLYADGEWYPPPPPLGWEGEWFAPPPPPEGVEEFPAGFFFSDKFDDFFSEDFFTGEGFDGTPPPFEDFLFEAFLENNSLNDIIPNLPPPFEHGAFGELAFGEVPPPPPGFPPFPEPPGFIAAFGDFGDAFGGSGEADPTDLPPEFFEFAETLAGLEEFLGDFEFRPLPEGESDVDGEPGDGDFFDEVGFVPFEDIAEFLPDDFLLQEAVLEVFEGFGQDHPLIGEGGEVNSDLETALDEHPPRPKGFDGFDFDAERRNASRMSRPR